MRFRNGWVRARWLTAVLALMTYAACDWNDLDEVQNSSNFAVVRAQFFASRTSRVPVPGVRLIVEADADAERPYNGPDVVGISGEDGVAVAKVFPGFTQQTPGSGGGSGGGTGTTTTGPRNPLELPPPLFFGDAAVTLIYNGQIAALIAGGLTIGSGRLYDLGTVFLDELLIEAD
jgi:hypothetical protein